ncbi:hypothetical protein [Streptomyces lydicus]|uniref:hypothetical protein n=1 Tax=Streptomyces lydicus TaxID=47763 RepID=UPI003421BE73
MSYLEAAIASQSTTNLVLPLPVWGLASAMVVLVSIAVVALVALAIVRLVVAKARSEDLPEVLPGLGQVFASLSCFLPWGSKQEAATPVNPSGAEGPAASWPPAVTIVAGQVAVGAAHRPAPETVAAPEGAGR